MRYYLPWGTWVWDHVFLFCLTHKCGIVGLSLLHVHACVNTVCGYGTMDKKLSKYRCWDCIAGWVSSKIVQRAGERLKFRIGPTGQLPLLVPRRPNRAIGRKDLRMALEAQRRLADGLLIICWLTIRIGPGKLKLIILKWPDVVIGCKRFRKRVKWPEGRQCPYEKNKLNVMAQEAQYY